MTSKEDILRMARQAGFEYSGKELTWESVICTEELERLVDLAVKPWADQLEVERKRFQELNDVVATGMQHARAAERRACAQLCERMWHEWLDSTEDSDKPDAEDCYRAIRARGQT